MTNPVRDVDALLLDLDGTVYLDNVPIGDMANTLRALRAAGKRLVYLTNNSSRSAEVTRRNIESIGLWDEADLVYTSGMATAEYLTEAYPAARVLCIGTPALHDEFAAYGIRLVEDAPDVVVLGYDTTLTYEKLCTLTRFVRDGAPFVATHPDITCPSLDAPRPDIGATLALVEASTGRRPDVVIGKPSRMMGDRIAARLALPPERILMVGDRLTTDIAFAEASGFRSLLVYSGETTPALYAASQIRATFTLPSLNDIVSLLD